MDLVLASQLRDGPMQSVCQSGEGSSAVWGGGIIRTGSGHCGI